MRQPRLTPLTIAAKTSCGQAVWFLVPSLFMLPSTSPSLTVSWLRRRLGAFSLALAGIGSAACSSHDEPPKMAGFHGTGGARSDAGNHTGGSTSDAGDSTSNDEASGQCTIGDSRPCRTVISSYLEQESCFVGVQYCDTGTWTKCTDPRDAD